LDQGRWAYMEGLDCVAACNGLDFLSRVPHGEGTFLASAVDGGRVSYGDTLSLIRRAAGRFRGEGTHEGDKVLLFAPATPESILAAVSALCSGCTVVPVDYTWPTPLLRYVIEQIGPTHLFCCTRNAEKAAESGFRGRLVLVDDGHPLGEGSRAPRWAQWLEEGVEEVPWGADPDAAALILFTSGSTGRPKGVVLSGGALCRSGQLVVDTFGWRSTDRFLNLGDLHTMSGFRNTCIAAWLAGCSVVAANPEQRDSVFSVLALAARSGCTLLGAGPHFIRLMNLCAGRGDAMPPSLRQVLCTGGFLSPQEASEFERHYGIPLINYYGLTETCGLCSADLHDASRTVAGNIGHPTASRMEVVDSDGRPLPDMEVGEIRVANDRLMSGYHGDQQRTAEVLRDGWFYTGDLGYRHPDGSFVLKGRKKNMINNRWTDVVHFEEVEMAMNGHPDVREAGVCSRLSRYGEEELVAFVVSDRLSADPRSGIRTIREFLSRTIGPRKTPTVFEFVEALPHTAAGKLKRDALGDWVHAGLSKEPD